MPREQLLVQKASTLQQGYGSVEEFIAQFKKGSLQLQSGCNLEQTLESKVTGVLNGIRETAGKVRASIRSRCGRSQQMAVTRALVDHPCGTLCKPKHRVAAISTGSTPGSRKKQESNAIMSAPAAGCCDVTRRLLSVCVLNSISQPWVVLCMWGVGRLCGVLHPARLGLMHSGKSRGSQLSASV